MIRDIIQYHSSINKIQLQITKKHFAQVKKNTFSNRRLCSDVSVIAFIFFKDMPTFLKTASSVQTSVLWLTHLCKLLVGDLQPGHVLLVQVVATHPLGQRPDVYVAQSLGARRPDELLRPDEHDLLSFLYQNPAEHRRQTFQFPVLHLQYRWRE